jgi:hypothetical protein
MLYSERYGMGRGFELDDLVDQIWESLRDTAVGQYGLFDQAFGYDVSEWTQDPADEKFIPGKVKDLEQFFNRQLKIRMRLDYQAASPDVTTPRVGPALGYTDDDGNFRHEPPPAMYKDPGLLFDLLEILYDLVAAPKFDPEKKRHTAFAKKDAQEVFREFINDDLMLAAAPHEMLANGQIVPLGTPITKAIVEDLVLLSDKGQVTKADYGVLNDAIRQFYHEGASAIEKKSAIAAVCSLVEKYSAKVVEHMLRDDERDLFRMANDFALRNAGPKQKRNYDKDVWYDWMFTVQLSAATTIIKILGQQKAARPAETDEAKPKKRGRGRPPKSAVAVEPEPSEEPIELIETE